MRPLRRNDKESQRIRLGAFQEAQQTLTEFHRLLARTSKEGMTVGKTVAMAAAAGLLHYWKTGGFN